MLLHLRAGVGHQSIRSNRYIKRHLRSCSHSSYRQSNLQLDQIREQVLKYVVRDMEMGRDHRYHVQVVKDCEAVTKL